ncbi:MAG: MBL fold metallo-hydrolase [Nitrospiraceae bacterium]|nr:MBL fold metallo-hydrolase [Nitrospiraceae bacterium]
MTTEPTRVVTLVDNAVGARGTLAEHGLSFWIERGAHRILFDTGAGTVLAHNADMLGVDLRETDAIVLSHGHYDHTGGLPTAMEAVDSPKVFFHPDALRVKYARDTDGTARDIGVRAESGSSLAQQGVVRTHTHVMTEIVPGVFVTGQIPRVTDFEDTGGPFYLDRQCQHPDPLFDDQALFFESSHGTIVVLGCAHSGGVNTLRHVHERTGGRHIHAVIGGTHLLTANAERVDRTIEALREFGVDHLAPCHCTGTPATAALWNAFPGKCAAAATGAIQQFC